MQMDSVHPHVLHCEAIFADRIHLYIVLPLADTSLSSLLASNPILPPPLAVNFAAQIAKGAMLFSSD
eukprot:tig00020951_g16428.t1